MTIPVSADPCSTGMESVLDIFVVALKIDGVESVRKLPSNFAVVALPVLKLPKHRMLLSKFQCYKEVTV